jgi:hypothetical protein
MYLEANVYLFWAICSSQFYGLEMCNNRRRHTKLREKQIYSHIGFNNLEDYFYLVHIQLMLILVSSTL